MDLSLNDDQKQVLDFVDSLTRPYVSAPLHDTSLALESAELDEALVESGFLDVLDVEELGAVTAALVVEKLAFLPFAVEAAASATVRPLLDPDLPRPVCVVEESALLSRPVRYLRAGASVVVIGAASVYSFTATDEMVRAASDETLYAYPMAFLTKVPDNVKTYDIAADEVRRLWRTALAAEGAGLLSAALQATTTYISERKQFGRPIATFQAIRHRMAQAQVMTNAAHWLAIRSAGTGDAGDAALALNYVQEAAKVVTYDYHQFLGAMGMTLEHPLHLWTYRLKALGSELGGRGANAQAAANLLWS